MRIETVLHPAEIALLTPEANTGWNCVVFDILRATTSIVTAIAHGAQSICPKRTIEEALAHREQYGEDWLQGGERNGDRIEGFDFGNSPAEYLDVAGKKIVTTTTNGTVGLEACRGAECILVGSLLNLEATAGEIKRRGTKNLRIVCAGTFSSFALEDGVAAGLLAGAFPDADLCDASRAMLCMVESAGSSWQNLVRGSRNGKALQRAGRGADIDWALRLNAFPVVVSAGEAAPHEPLLFQQKRC